MLNVNPFGSKEVKEKILEESGVIPSEDASYEIEYEDVSDFKNIISNTPIMPKSSENSLKTIIKDAGAVLKDTQEAKVQQMNTALSDMMTKYNKDFGLDLHVDFNNFTKTLVACADSRNQKVLELFVSKVVRSIRPILILGMISKLALALDVLLSPDKLLNPNELSLTDLFLATDQILNYISKLEELKGELMIENEDLELRKLAEENGLEYKDTDEELINNFISLFKKDNGIK